MTTLFKYFPTEYFSENIQFVLLCIEPTENYFENFFDSKHLKTSNHQVCREIQATE